jgi:hypothetical protein
MNRYQRCIISILLSFFICPAVTCRANDKNLPDTESISIVSHASEDTANIICSHDSVHTLSAEEDDVYICSLKQDRKSLYALPYSVNLSEHNWGRMWINTAVLSGAFVGALFALELLPEDETCWNREEMHSVPMHKRWFRNVFKRGPEWDGDKFYFNFILHPYAGSVYFMSARSCGFNMWQSLLYCACVSTFGWEFGVEAFNERPSYQDLFVTPLLGSAIGEGFYCIKRYIAAHDYKLLGSKILGNIVVFIVDPVNEVIGLFAGNEARHIHDKKIDVALAPMLTNRTQGFSLSATF